MPMTNSAGYRYGNQGLREWGFGNNLPAVPGSQRVTQSDFAGGYDVRDSRADVPRNSSPYFLDMEVSAKDEIIRSPGVAALETFSVRTPSQLVPHASLDLDAELLLLDAPYLGVYTGGAVSWVDHSLPIGVYAWTNYGGALVLSDGITAMYVREPGGIPAVVTDGPPARAYANFAGRIFAGNVMDTGVNLPLGIMWNASSSDYEDWTGLGSGAEELISNRLEVDYIQALVPLGFSQMAVVMRRSIWLGTRTGLADRPADFDSRIEGDGAVSPRCVVATPYGVAYLSDDGLKVFDGQSAAHLSPQIDHDMLPDSFDSVVGYELYYHEKSDRLYLATPTALWVYDFKHKRWYRRSLVAHASASFGLGAPDSYDMYFLGADSLGRVTLGKEDPSSVVHFDAVINPLWEFPLEEGQYINQIVSTIWLHVEYLGYGRLEFWQPGVDGEFEFAAEVDLTTKAGKPALVPVSFMHSGLGLGLQLRVISGQPRISAIGVDFILQGPKIPTASARPVTLIAVKLPSGNWVFIPYNQIDDDDDTGGFLEEASGSLTLHEGLADTTLFSIRRNSENYVTITEV